MVILSKAYKPDNFELHNSLKLSSMSIWGLHLSFVDCKSFLESNFPDILALCESYREIKSLIKIKKKLLQIEENS